MSTFFVFKVPLTDIQMSIIMYICVTPTLSTLRLTELYTLVSGRLIISANTLSSDFLIEEI